MDGSGKQGAARKREWGEVTSAAAPRETVYSPLTPNWGPEHRVRGRGAPRSSTPRGRETPSWATSTKNGRGGGTPGPSGRSRGHAAAGGWRRASADFGQSAMAAARSAEDSLGYPLLPCDGRECKVRSTGIHVWYCSGTVWLLLVVVVMVVVDWGAVLRLNQLGIVQFSSKKHLNSNTT